MQTNNDSDLSLEKITRIVLIFSIITVSGAIVYSLTRPPEKDLILSVLNENQALKDYPTKAKIGENISIYAYVENHLQENVEFSLRIYQGNESLDYDINFGVSNNSNANYLFNQTFNLINNESWISDQINVSFEYSGNNQLIILELWKNTENGWIFIPEYVVHLRIDIYL